MELTANEIADLATLAGFSVSKDELDDQELQTEITISESNGTKIAFYSEYPEKGCTPLG